jgi:hypothetical protein
MGRSTVQNGTVVRWSIGGALREVEMMASFEADNSFLRHLRGIISRFFASLSGTRVMPPRAWIEELEFSDGTKSEVGRDDIIVLVGPNNAGKSKALLEINWGVVGDNANVVLRSIITKAEVTHKDV